MGGLARHATSCGLSGRWTVDKIRPDMLDRRVLIPAHYGRPTSPIKTHTRSALRQAGGFCGGVGLCG